jgi:hypothetical protein
MVLLLVTTVGTIVVCAGLGLAAPVLVRVLPPRSAVVLLAGGSVCLAVAAGSALTALGWALAGRLARIAAGGHWSAELVAVELPVPAWLGVVAAALVSILLVRAVIRTVRIVVLLTRAESVCRALSPRGGARIVLTDDGLADAFTIGGFHGRVVASRRLLVALGAVDRRVVIAHEWSHLRCRHHLYAHLAEIAAAAGPFLRAVPGAVRFGIERWADEDAASAIGDRDAAARSLARVALARRRLRDEPAGPAGSMRIPGSGNGPAPTLGAVDRAVAARVLALLTPSPATRWGRTALLAAAAIGLVATGLVSLHLVHEVIEQATAVYHADSALSLYPGWSPSWQ